jgi:hypothetical protein
MMVGRLAAGGAAVPLKTCGEEGTVALQIEFVDFSLEMPRAVVLVDPPSPVDP